MSSERSIAASLQWDERELGECCAVVLVAGQGARERLSIQNGEDVR